MSAETTAGGQEPAEGQAIAAAAAFAAEGFTRDGITVCVLGDDGEWIVAVGHHDPDRFLAVADAAWQAAFDEPLENLADLEVHHRMASFTPPDHAAGEGWYLRWANNGDPRPAPVTVLETGF